MITFIYIGNNNVDDGDALAIELIVYDDNNDDDNDNDNDPVITCCCSCFFFIIIIIITIIYIASSTGSIAAPAVQSSYQATIVCLGFLFPSYNHLPQM